MKLTKKAREELRRVLYHAERAQSYLKRDNVAVCHKGGPPTTTLHYTREVDGSTLYELRKDCGSDLCGLDEATTLLGRFLATH